MSHAERPATAASLDYYLLAVRILGVMVFLPSGYFKVMQWPAIINTLTQAGAPLPMLGGYLAVAAELGASTLVILGLFTRPAALALILYTAGTMIIAHRFWEFTGPAQVGQIFSFFKNLDLVLMLGFLVMFGGGRFSLRR